MHVLLIAQAYPPFPVVGALRARKVALALRDQGHTVHVVTERLAGETAALRVDEPGLKVHTVAVGLQYRLRVVAMRKRWRRGSGAAPAPSPAPAGTDAAAGGPAEPEAHGGFLRRLALALLWLPDDEQRFIVPALRASRAILPQGVDLVYSTAPSFSSHVVGLVLRRTRPVRWVAEFRDPWTDQRAGRADAIPSIERIHRWLERRCLLAADRIVAVTEGARRGFVAKLPPDQQGKVLLALNGIDELAPAGGARPPGPFRIVYAGTFYHNRDPRPFLTALAALRAEQGLTAADVRVDFAGHCRTYDEVSVEGEVARHGLQDLVHFHDWMPHDAMQRMLRDADLVFLIALGQPLQVPNKVFDYLGTRRPVLAVVDAGGESEQMLRRVGGHHVVAVPVGAEATVEDTASALRAALEAHRTGAARTVAAGGEAQLDEWLASRQMRRLVDAIAT